MSIFTRHSHVPNTILTDKGRAVTPEVLKQTIEEAGIKVKYETIKHAQTIGMMERNQQKLETIFKFTVSADQSQWDEYVNIAAVANNTTFHASVKCAPTENIHGFYFQEKIRSNF